MGASMGNSSLSWFQRRRRGQPILNGGRTTSSINEEEKVEYVEWMMAASGLEVSRQLKLQMAAQGQSAWDAGQVTGF